MDMGALVLGIDTRCDHERKQVAVSCLFPELQKQEMYDLWVHLDLLPAFMRGLIDDDMPEIFALPWSFRIGNRIVHWEAWTTERVPAERIAWRSVDGLPYQNHGCVTFHSPDNRSTRISVSVQFNGSGAAQIDEQTLTGIERVFRNTIVALRILARPCATTQMTGSLLGS